MQGCSAKKERTQKTSHFQQRFKLIFKSVFNEVFTFITLQTKTFSLLRCCAKGRLYFTRRLEQHTQEICVKVYIFMSGYYEKSVGTPIPRDIALVTCCKKIFASHYPLDHSLHNSAAYETHGMCCCLQHEVTWLPFGIKLTFYFDSAVICFKDMKKCSEVLNRLQKQGSARTRGETTGQFPSRNFKKHV